MYSDSNRAPEPYKRTIAGCYTIRPFESLGMCDVAKAYMISDSRMRRDFTEPQLRRRHRLVRLGGLTWAQRLDDNHPSRELRMPRGVYAGASGRNNLVLTRDRVRLIPVATDDIGGLIASDFQQRMRS